MNGFFGIKLKSMKESTAVNIFTLLILVGIIGIVFISYGILFTALLTPIFLTQKEIPNTAGFVTLGIGLVGIFCGGICLGSLFAGRDILRGQN